MIDTSAAYKTAVNADSRQWVPKVEVYFDGDGSAPTTFDGDDIAGLYLLEEARTEGDNPLGLVSANELTVTLDNSERSFTPTNSASPYYGKLKPGLLVKAWLGLVLPDTSVEYIPLGVFRCGDWTSPSESVESTTICNDRLHRLGAKTIPMIPATINITTGGLFSVLFDALGLNGDETEGDVEYVINPGVGQALTIGVVPKGQVMPALQEMAVGGNAFVSADREGVVQVKSNIITDDFVATWTQGNQIYTIENPQRYLDAYSGVRIGFKRPRRDPLEPVLTINNIRIPNGGLNLVRMEFTSAPVAYVEQVRLVGAVNSAVADVEYGAWTITLQLTNMGAAETVDIEVIGQDVDYLSSDYTAEDAAAVAAIGEKELYIESRLIQELDAAQRYGDQVLQYVSDPLVNFELETRGDPSVEVGDVVQVSSTVDKVPATDIVIQRQELSFDGGLQCRVRGRRAYTPFEWVYVSPGFWARIQV